MPSPVRSRTRFGLAPVGLARVGFTVVELLVVLAIIILLVGILLVGLNQAAGTAQAAQTRFLMNSMAAGLVQFKRDHGYLPPVLGDGSQYAARTSCSTAAASALPSCRFVISAIQG